MQENLLQFFIEQQQWAILISLLLSILIAVLGIIPSYFITAANVLFFGFWPGLIISIIGESIGAGLAFILYRKGFQQKLQQKLLAYPKLTVLISAEGKKAFWLILLCRIIPFIPSGLVSFGASLGKVTFFIFFMASTIGKIPALLIEAYSVLAISHFTLAGKIIMGIIALVLIIVIITGSQKNKPIA